MSAIIARGCTAALISLSAILAAGAPADRAAVLVANGTLPGQQTRAGTIGQIFESTTADAPDGPCLLLVGNVVGLREHLRWFDLPDESLMAFSGCILNPPSHLGNDARHREFTGESAPES